MTKQALIVGLGRFGISLLHGLADRGVEVLAVDSDAERVERAAPYAAEAVVLDATVEGDLRRIHPADRDLCFCTIGDDSREASILCTALLRQLGAKRVVARANSELQGRILRLVGAHEVVNPLEEFGKRFADQFALERLKGELPLGGDLVIAEISPPDSVVGKSLAELKLPSRYSLTVVATRKGGKGGVKLPSQDQCFEQDDIIVVVARKSSIVRFLEDA